MLSNCLQSANLTSPTTQHRCQGSRDIGGPCCIPCLGKQQTHTEKSPTKEFISLYPTLTSLDALWKMTKKTQLATFLQSHYMRWLSGKEYACNAGDAVWSLSWEDALEEGMATHSSMLAWRIPATEELGGLQPMGLQRVEHIWVIQSLYNIVFIYMAL